MAETLNPYIAGNPITGTEMFFGREDVFDFIHQALIGKHQDNVLVLYGQRRTGKTSVLYQMRHHMDERYMPIFIDLHGMALESLNGFILELANIISRSLRRSYAIELPPLDRAEFAADARSAFETTFLEGIWERVGEHQLLLMLDEAIRLEEQVRAGKLNQDVFDYLRHLMQHHARLNFLFSLGSGLEEMEKEYAFLFNVALYKKISFLDRTSAIALITRPVENIYQVETDATERILEVTSAHPYFTQLICHGLFNYCVSKSINSVTADDVNAVLDEAVERGLAVLKHVWEESDPAEKAVLSALAVHGEALPFQKMAAADESTIKNAWFSLGEDIPRGDIASAVKRLIARDVIVASPMGGYRFTVELQRMWVQKYRRLDWTQEEIKDWLGTLPNVEPLHPETAPPRSPISWRLAPLAAILSIIGICGICLLFSPSRSLILGAFSALQPTIAPGVNNVPLVAEAAKITSMENLDGYIWAGTDAGLVRWDMDGNHTLYSVEDINLDCVNTILAEPQSILWLGCGGVSQLELNQNGVSLVEYYDRDSGLATGTVRSLAMDASGDIWAGGHADPGKSPLSHFTGGTWQETGPEMDALIELGQEWASIRSIMVDQDGQLWLGADNISAGGVARWVSDHYDKFVYTGEGLGGEDRRVKQILQDGNGNVWVAASSLGLLNLLLDNGEFFPIAMPNYEGEINEIVELTDGSLWVGGSQYVARSIDGGINWEQVGSTDGLGEEILAIVQDDDGRIWAGAYSQGMSILENNIWHRLP